MNPSSSYPHPIPDMHLAEIWRYPIKSMAGERLENAQLSPSGIEGDRIVQVQNGQRRAVTSRTHPGLLGLKATLDASGKPLVDRRPWNDPGGLAKVRRIAGPGARFGVNGLEEREWPGSQLRIGEVLISVVDLRPRCVMTTFDPDTLAHDPDVLWDIVNRFGGRLALNCEVIEGGGIRVGQQVELLRAR